MKECDVSIVIPSLNECESLGKIIMDTFTAIRNIDKSVEVIVVDDGSNDDTELELSRLQQSEPDLIVIAHRTNLGKARSLMDGFAVASGKYIGFIDADYQFHPSDFPTLIDALDQCKCDFANGVRIIREDPKGKKIASRIFNILNGVLFRNTDVADWNSGIKVMRSEIAKSFVLCEGDHRLLVAIASIGGFKVKGYRVHHTERQFGTSKYGGIRLLTGPFDLLALKVKELMGKRPFTIFGLFGSLMIVIGMILGLILVYEQQMLGQLIGERPLLILVVLLEIFGFQMFIFGYLAEKLKELEILVGPRVKGEVKKSVYEDAD